jgi:ATP-dependent DNA ligase
MNRIAPTLMTRDGEMVLGHACKMGLEGIVSKRKGLALPQRQLA